MSALPSTGRADHAVLGADATHVLYERHGSRIFAFCYSRLGSREEAEDATQTTFLNAFRSLQGGLVPAFELAWLFRIADNVCRDRRKAAWRRNRLEATRDLEELQDVLPAPENGSDGLAGLDAALASMPERQRRAILLREWQGLSYGEIAAELGVSRAAVETLIFRARRSLARGLEEPQQTGRRAGFDVTSLLALLKTLFQGGGAAKVAASVAAVAGAGLVVAAPLRDTERARPELRANRPALAVTPAASERSAQPSSRPATGIARKSPLVTIDGPVTRERARPATHPAPESGRTPSRPAGKTPAPTSAPAAAPEARPESPAPSPPPAAPEAPAAGPLPPPPPLPSVPETPSLPAVPAVEPPPLPELPGLDVPELPGVPSLP